MDEEPAEGPSHGNSSPFAIGLVPSLKIEGCYDIFDFAAPDAHTDWLSVGQWSPYLEHPNLLPPAPPENSHRAPASPRNYRSLSRYLSLRLDNRPLNRPAIDLMHDIAGGLSYLHSHDIVHGDLKPENILISESGEAVIAYSPVAEMERRHETFERDAAYRRDWRYSAPELLSGSYSYANKASDVYSFGNVCYEILTETRPYEKLESDFDLVVALSRCEPLVRRPTIADDVWEMLNACWSEPKERPSMKEISDFLAHRQSRMKIRHQQSGWVSFCSRNIFFSQFMDLSSSFASKLFLLFFLLLFSFLFSSAFFSK
ncbi:kinase-like domain-containing protein [Mycena floridula]|nr:kinase-like domain-containing protein [Mycena floridula]